MAHVAPRKWLGRRPLLTPAPESLQEQVLDLLARGATLANAKRRDPLSVENDRRRAAMRSLGAARPAVPHAGWMAAPRLTIRGGAFPFPI